jgi:hypothetical protein
MITIEEVTIVFRSSGSVIEKNCLTRPAPSIRAA